MFTNACHRSTGRAEAGGLSLRQSRLLREPISEKQTADPVGRSFSLLAKPCDSQCEQKCLGTQEVQPGGIWRGKCCSHVPLFTLMFRGLHDDNCR